MKSIVNCNPKHCHFKNPKLTAVVEGDTMIVTIQGYAKSVEILNDHYFDMNAGIMRGKVLSGKAEN